MAPEGRDSRFKKSVAGGSPGDNHRQLNLSNVHTIDSRLDVDSRLPAKHFLTEVRTVDGLENRNDFKFSEFINVFDMDTNSIHLPVLPKSATGPFIDNIDGVDTPAFLPSTVAASESLSISKSKKQKKDKKKK
jgi:hypothetical protein